MKNIISLYTAIAICISLISGCNNDDSGTNPPANDKPLVTLVGTPTGIAVTASIDANGGTLSSADGVLQLTIPAGAVSSATSFSIQPITNHCPGGIVMAYRLLPEDITFAQPISLSFTYTDSLPVNEMFLAIAYQGADKTWFAPKAISLNVDKNEINVQTKHFSDWAVFQKISIKPMDETVKINESLALEVIFVDIPKSITDNDGYELYNLNISKTYTSAWQVNGTGGNDISGYIVKQGQDKATYSAPSKVPAQNPVAVSATLSNVSFTLNGETFKNPKVISYIRIIGNETRFSVEFTSSRPHQPVGNSWFTETDRGSMSVLLQDDSVRVYAIQNMRAEVTPEFIFDTQSECTYTLISSGDGLFNISPDVDFGGVFSPFDNKIYIGVISQTYSKGFTPSFKITCNSGSPQTIGGEELPTAPSQFSFDIKKDYQEFVQVIQGNGVWPDGFMKTAITKIK